MSGHADLALGRKGACSVASPAHMEVKPDLTPAETVKPAEDGVMMPVAVLERVEAALMLDQRMLRICPKVTAISPSPALM